MVAQHCIEPVGMLLADQTIPEDTLRLIAPHLGEILRARCFVPHKPVYPLRHITRCEEVVPMVIDRELLGHLEIKVYHTCRKPIRLTLLISQARLLQNRF
jgi:hypothetical protein